MKDNPIIKTGINKNLLKLRRILRGVALGKITKLDRSIYLEPLFNNINNALISFSLSFNASNLHTKLHYAEQLKSYVILICIDSKELFEARRIHCETERSTESLNHSIALILANLELDTDKWVNGFRGKLNSQRSNELI